MFFKSLMVTLLLFVSCKAEVTSAKMPTEVLIAIQLQKLANKGKSTIEFQDSLAYTNTVCPDMSDTTLINKAEAGILRMGEWENEE